MFACRVSMHLKPSSAAEFIQKLENEIIPLLRRRSNSCSFPCGSSLGWQQAA